mmetsp:Transcript_19956/g.34182  ORF Transcript_19956/g.34182 Transcript_19956/m.34182 type:complete len:138 (-) Transcript_19956:101-514(-)
MLLILLFCLIALAIAQGPEPAPFSFSDGTDVPQTFAYTGTETRESRAYYWDEPGVYDNSYDYDYYCRKRSCSYGNNYGYVKGIYTICAVVFFPMFCLCLLGAGFIIYNNGKKLVADPAVEQPVVVGSEASDVAVTIV